MISAIRLPLSAFAGAALGAAHLLLAGFVDIQAGGREEGGIYSLNNGLVAITEPITPIFHYISLVALCGVALWINTAHMASKLRSTRTAFQVGYSLLVLILSTCALTLVEFPKQGINQGWTGWLIEGGINPAMHLSLLVVVYGLISGAPLRVRERHKGSSANINSYETT